MASFTPQEIEQFLQQFFDTVGARQYVGARYVPIFGRAGSDTVEWDDTAPYEPLTVVMHAGVSYVSRRYVPAGIDIADTGYWVQTYRFNAQVEQYRQEVLAFQGQIDEIREDFVPFPDVLVLPKYGTLGQVLTTLANGETKWEDPVVPSDAQAEAVITEWLNDHPEATTTVLDNSLSLQKFTSAALALISCYKGTLGSSTDLDDIADYIGIFECSSPINAPVSGSGILMAFGNSGSKRTQMYFVSNSDALYIRFRRSNNSWGDWHILGHVDDGTITVPMLSNALFNRLMMYKDSLTAITDANAAESVGIQAINVGASNIPINSNGLLVSFGNLGYRGLQLFYPTSYTALYYRTKNTSGIWGEWETIATQAIVSAYYAVIKLVLDSMMRGNGLLLYGEYAPNDTYDIPFRFGTYSDTGRYVTSQNQISSLEFFAPVDSIIEVENPSTSYQIVINGMVLDSDGSIQRTVHGVYSTRELRYEVQDECAFFTAGFYDAASTPTITEDYGNGKLKVLPPNSGTVSNDVSFKYVDANKYLVTFGDFCVDMRHYVNAGNDQDNWNMIEVKDLSGNVLVPASTDIIGPISISGESDFISGTHGSSTTTLFKAYVDGSEVDLTDTTLNAGGDELIIIMQDECRSADDPTQHLLDKFVTLSFTHNKINVKNTFKNVSGNSLQIARATNGGLFAAYSSIINSVALNTYQIASGPTQALTGTDSPKNISAVVNTDYGVMKLNNILGHELGGYSGYIHVFTNESPIRTKIYFDTMSNESLADGAIVAGEFEYGFSK